MLITPLQLQKEPLEFDLTLAPGAIDYTPEVQQAGPLALKGTADLIVEHRGPREFVEDIRLRAHYEGAFELPCARCLDPVPQQLSGDFDLIFRPTRADSDPGEHAITTDETEIGYYEESGLSLEDVVREQVLLSLPGRVLCRPDCKGLCPQCGQNLNQATCQCTPASADPRWNALAGLASELKK